MNRGSVSSFPADWKDHLEACVKNGCGRQRCACRASDSEQQTISRLLGNERSERAARILWEAATPETRRVFFMYFYHALYWLAFYNQPRPRHESDRSPGDNQKIVDALIQVRKDGHPFWGRDMSSPGLDGAIEYYRWRKSNAPRTKKPDRALNTCREILRHDFGIRWGRHMDEAVGLLLEAAFGGKHDADTIRVRVSEQRRRHK